MDDQPDIEGIADLALGEIARRFEEQPKEIPDHVLAKYFTDVNKVIDRRSEKQDEEESRPFSLLEELPTLPPARARALLEEEVARLRLVLETHEHALQELDAGGLPDSQE